MSDPPRAGDGDTPQTTPVATAVAPAGAARSDPASTGVAQGQASSVTSAAGTTGRPPRPGPPPTLEVMSPQLLVPYLTDSSVPPPAHAIVAPLTFMPPQPGVTASSRATYQVAP